MDTPFVFGRLATKENFTDREVETLRLKQNFSALVNTIIISPRRWGKSSLVHKASIEAQKQDATLRICHIDLFNVRSEQHFYQMLLEGILKCTSSKFEEALAAVGEFLGQIMPKLVFSAEPSPQYSVELEWEKTKNNADEILDLAEKIAIKKNIKVVVCIDEFQNIASFADSEYLQRRLRAHWQTHQHVGYCFFGSKRHMMLEVFAKASKPFYKFGDLMFLQKIPRPEMVDFICRRFAETDKKIVRSTAALIVDLVDDHPYYIQQLSQLSWLRSREVCDEATVRVAHEGLVEQLSLLFINMVETLTNSQLSYLRAMLDKVEAFTSTDTLKRYGFPSATAVMRAKAALIEKDIIDTLAATPVIQDPVFAYWLKHDYFI